MTISHFGSGNDIEEMAETPESAIVVFVRIEVSVLRGLRKE